MMEDGAAELEVGKKEGAHSLGCECNP